MANYTLETNRNDAIAAIPRLTFQMPQSTTSAVTSTTIPIFFCQTGCQLESQFENITSAQLKNNGSYFTIIPTDNSNNYINWNGSGANGQNMIRFDLKEIKFEGPARDVVGSITYNKSIQFYMIFVNSTYPNIMIVMSIIGQSNNVGTAQTDGYILLNSLANQIPIRNDIKNVSNLENINLGNLLPSNKSFFSTLINGNSIQYISMTRIIDIPDTFLKNLISRVVGSNDAYETKVSQYTKTIPTNPQGTIIFYTENINPINSDQAYVCNSNCDRVVGDASLLNPTFGKTNTVRDTNYVKSSGSSPTSGAPPARLPQEECEEEYVYPGMKTNVNVKSAGGSSVSKNELDDKSNNDLSKNEHKSSVVQGILIAFFIIIIIIVGSILIIIFLCKATNISGFSSFFSRELWNASNLGWIFTGLIGLCSNIIFTSIALSIIIKQYQSDNKDNNEKEKLPWILLIIGLSIYIICFGILLYKSRTYLSNRMSTISGIPTSNSIFPSRSVRIQDIPINPSLKEFNGISKFNEQTEKILSNYQKSKSSYLQPGSKGIDDIIEASQQYSKLPQLAKNTLAKYNPSLAPYLDPRGQFIKNIKLNSGSFPGNPTLNNLYESLKYYNQLRDIPVLITKELLDNLQKYQSHARNGDLQNILKKMIVGQPIPIELYKYISKV